MYPRGACRHRRTNATKMQHIVPKLIFLPSSLWMYYTHLYTRRRPKRICSRNYYLLYSSPPCPTHNRTLHYIHLWWNCSQKTSRIGINFGYCELFMCMCIFSRIILLTKLGRKTGRMCICHYYHYRYHSLFRKWQTPHEENSQPQPSRIGKKLQSICVMSGVSPKLPNKN